MSTVLNIGQQVKVKIAPTTASGEASEVESVVFESSNPAVLSVTNEGVATALLEGFAQITVSADARLGEGVVTIKADVSIAVRKPEAAYLNPTVELIEPKAVPVEAVPVEAVPVEAVPVEAVPVEAVPVEVTI